MKKYKNNYEIDDVEMLISSVRFINIVLFANQ